MTLLFRMPLPSRRAAWTLFCRRRRSLILAAGVILSKSTEERTMSATTEQLTAALRDVCAAESRWRDSTEASGRLAADAALRHAAARGRQLLGLETAAAPRSVGHWIDTHVED